MKMLKKVKKFVTKCNNFLNLYPNKIDEIDMQLKSLQDECVDIQDVKDIQDKIDSYDEKLMKLKEEFINLNYKIDSLSLNFDCTNLEYLNLDHNVSKRRVLIVGFYGASNLGDELMLFAILNKISLYDSILDITVMLSENYAFDITRYPKCKIIHYPKNIMDINTLANYYDVVIFGGGALLDDTDYNLNKMGLSLGTTLVNLAYRMITCKKKVLLYGLSSNYELKNPEYIDKLNFIANNANYFSLRDTNSLEVLEKCGISIDKIDVVHDLAFTYNCLDYIKGENKNLILKVGLIYVCNEENYKKLFDLTKNMIKFFKDKDLKYKIVMIPFYEYLNNDTSYYKKMLEEINDENIEVLNYPNPVEDIFNIISKLDVCVSMRYHGTLISNMVGVPTLNLLFDCHRHYKNKVAYLYEKYGYKNYQINFSQINKSDYINTLEKLCDIKENKKLNKKINIEANEQINEVINKFIIDKDEELK